MEKLAAFVSQYRLQLLIVVGVIAVFLVVSRLADAAAPGTGSLNPLIVVGFAGVVSGVTSRIFRKTEPGAQSEEGFHE